MVARRGFLLALVTAGCTSEPRAKPRPSKPVATKPPAGPADWAALKKGLSGRLVRPGDATYAEARRLYIPRFDRVRPAGVVYCADPQDVGECLAFARRLRLPVAVRSGGHSYAGWSTGTGLVIDVSPMKTVKASGDRAVIGAGARLIDVYEGLADAGAGVPMGTCPTVGIAGLTLGGGLGVLSRQYGLTCDVLDSVRVVTADGRVLDCDGTRNADLYWACRGGGGGNFAVATEFTFRTHRAAEVTTFTLRWSWGRAAAVIRGWQTWAPSGPDEMWSSLQLNTEPSDGAPTVEITGLSLGDPPLDRITGIVGADPQSRAVRRRPYLDAMRAMAGCSSEDRACHPPRTEYAAKSHMASRPLPGPAIDVLVGRFTDGNDVADRSVLLDALGGAVGRLPPGDTAFPHRAALFSAQYLAGTGDRGWLRAVHGAMEPHIGGTAYVNYIDPELTGWQRAYHGGNYDRLAKVKAAYDPEGVFRFPQAIR